MKYLLIDGNNLAIRSAFANELLSNKEGIPTGVHYGFFQSLISIKQKYPDYQFLIVWDGKSKRRVAEANAAVEQKIIQSGYKANRKKDEQPKPLLDFYSQSPFLKKGLGQTGIPQIRLEDFEADDVIASYCRILKKENEIIVVTSDNDYMQLLDQNVIIFDGMKQKTITLGEWSKENGILPEQFIDCGALSGDDSDNIHGVPSIGEKTALKIIKEHGTWQKALDAYRKQLDPYRKDFPDLINNPSEFSRLSGMLTEKKKSKYPEITIDMPYNGVALAIEDNKIKEKIPKTTIMAVMFCKRIELAFSLKKMDDNITNLPEIQQGKINREKLIEYFDYYDIESLRASVDILGG